MSIVRSSVWPVSCLLLIFLATAAPAAERANDALVGEVLELLSSSDHDVRGLALEQVRYYTPGEAVTKRFAAELPRLDADAQVGLLRALADRGDRTAHAEVLALSLTATSESVEAAAIGALSRLGERSDVPLLVNRLSSKSKPVQAAARRGLVDLQGEGVSQAIAERMTQAEPSVRVMLIYVLSDRRAEDTIPQLLLAAKAEDRSVREAAMVALAWIAAPKWVPEMVPALFASEDKQERAAAEKAIMKVCARVANPDDRAKPLIDAMAKLPGDERLALLSTMGRVGGAAALEEIEKAIASDDAKLHELGLKALSNWPDASIAPRYVELVASEELPANRLLALRALIRVAPLRDRRTHAERLQLLQQAMELSSRDQERNLVLDRARAVRTLETLQFIAPYMEQPELAEQACLSVVELAHHRNLREPNKAEFHKALDKVIATSQDEVVVDRAQRYKNDKTWVRPR